MTDPYAVPPAVLDLLRSARRITVLTGAGMSAESGVPTFRDAQSGLWERFDPMQLATPQAWEADPEMVWAWYLWRAALVRRVEPHAGHRALAALAAREGVAGVRREVLLVTQNVDDLHERAGSEVLAHVHGSLLDFRCAVCASRAPTPELPEHPVDRAQPPRCRRCGGLVRPGVVWFGEMLPARQFRLAETAHADTDLVLVVGTSGVVHPAAGLPLISRANGIPVVEINPDETGLSDVADYCWRISAASGLPALLAGVLDPLV